ncbi:SusC/RagA family TonB-linked outer membrane protein [Mariniflexile sp. AS56]|uniref:SusC/RagA family TonB-linked outer membrane protein n=1 Tax=Mariniflexile sp. AS56 TaxID=3063957 RepID=UPI0026EF73D0|nr:TonB-dependent receptor [Mariniflexile sp. AS56]MDO7172942.1 TonB-dependent receptor [Mariniflexile sp. AS56]
MKKNVLRLLFCLVLFLTGISASAQTQSVSGIVSDSQFPLPGVNIIVKNSAKGATTDFDGNYSLSDLSATDIVVFSYVGYKTQEITVGNQTTINVRLIEAAASLDEVVIVGYGTTNKRELTGSIGTIKGDAIATTVAGNPASALQGKLTGIQVENPGGKPGAKGNVFIRGVNSLSNADPLYIIDGLFVDDMSYVNPLDIENISVLKDAAAAAIYGSRAANGVVLIKTNHGRKNRDLEVTFNSRIGFDTPSKKLDFINGQQYTDYLNQRFVNDGSSSAVSFNGVDTDWQDENLQSGIIEDYGISLSGGGEKSSFYSSINYFNQDGILVGSGFKRLNARLNSEHEFGKFKVSQSLGLAEGKLQDNNWYGFDGTTAPTVALRNETNDGGFEAPSTNIHGPGGVNQFGLATLEDNLETTRTLFASLKLDYEITEELTAGINLGVDYTTQKRFQFTPTYFMSTVDAVRNVNDLNDLTEFNQEDINLLFEPTLSYSKTIDEAHKVSAVVGYTRFIENQKSSGIYGQGTPANSIRVVGALPSNDQNILLGQDNEAGLISYFGRLNYGYNDKYLFSGTLRRDASSRFAKANQVGYFPAISAGWNISNEDFWKSEMINFFKLRVSYGELGSYPDVFYPTQAVFLANQSNTSFGGGTANGLAQTTLADENLVWETTKTFDIGVDMSLLNSALTFSADYYSKDVEDALVPISIPSTAGVSLPVTRNAGTLINNGFEFDVTYRKSEGDFTYSVGTNFSFNLKNEAKDIPATILGPGIDEDLRVVNRTEANGPVGAFYGYIVEDKVDPATGDFIRVDTDGVAGITSDDQTIIGNPTPDFTYGLNFNGKYKKFDIALNFNGVSGNEIYNLSKYYNILWQDGGKLTDVLNSWTPSNTDTSIPRASVDDAAGNKAPSSFFVEDGSYFRLKNMEFGYNFGENVLGVDWIKSVRLSLNIQNVFVITDYSGYDPDVASTNSGRANINSGVPGVRSNVNPLLGRGLDQRAYPNARTFMLGLQAKF